MKERPILFSGEMVRAVDDDRKTKTRRTRGLEVVNAAPDRWSLVMQGSLLGRYAATFHRNEFEDAVTCFCPYGVSGDRLWVRETWATVNTLDHLSPSATFQYDRPPSVYMAAWTGAARNSENRGKWRPSIHMPRWASRLTLDVVSIGVERVQDITADGATAEGVCEEIDCAYATRHRDMFAKLWDSINANRGYGWDTNPYVWVVEFKRCS